MAVMVSTRTLTRADLDALPDDGLRHELIDGTYAENAHASGEQILTIDQPFVLRLTPTDLLRG